MANNCIILGPSGTGKSSAIKGLNPEETIIINVLNKAFPFKGSKVAYKAEKKNLAVISDWNTLIAALQSISSKEEYKHVKNIVIDDAIYIMQKEFFDRIKEKGYEKFNEIGFHFQQIMKTCEGLRDNLNIFFILHSEDVVSDGTIVGTKIRTIGKLVDDKYNLSELVTVLLMTEVRYKDDGSAEFGFSTKRKIVNGKEYISKCFGEGTKVRMADLSLKSIEDIKVGDLVLNSNGKPSKVASVHSGEDDLYEIVPHNTMPYIVNSAHILCTDSGEISTIDAYNSNGQYKGILGVYDGDIEIKEPYFLGMWLGDGDSSHTSITSPDEELKEYCREISSKYGLNFCVTPSKSKAFELNMGNTISYTKEIHKYTLEGEYITTYSSLKEAAELNNIKCPSNISACASGKSSHCGGYLWKYGKILKYNPLKEILVEYNMLNNKHIPEEFEFASLESKLQFLAGVIDTDGTKDYNRYHIVNKSFQVANMLKKLANSCGLYSYLFPFHVKGYEQEYYHICIYGDITKIPTIIERKKATKSSRNTNYLTINKLEKGKYFGFSLEGETKTFFLEDYTIVHNSPAGMFEEDFIPNDLGIVTKAMEEYYNEI